jgi:hypothetical protein
MGRHELLHETAASGGIAPLEWRGSSLLRRREMGLPTSALKQTAFQRGNTHTKQHRPATSGASWDDYQSAAWLVALPGVLNILKRNTFRLHTKLPAGSMLHDLLQGVD